MERQAVAKLQKMPTGNDHPHRQSARSSSARNPLLELQRSVGNQAIQRLTSSPFIQAKLQISAPEDESEQEADRVADSVMRMPEPVVSRQAMVQPVSSHITPLAQRETDEEDEIVAPKSKSHIPVAVREDGEEEKPLVQRACDECEEEKQQDQGHAGGMVHRESGAQTATPKVTTSVAANIHAMNGGGRPLPATTRAFFEPRFGADLSQVRVHTDSRATATANSIQARAFTVGPNIAFGAGQYAPESRAGRQLLAHELTHVVQQNGGQVQRAQPLAMGHIQRWEWFDQMVAVGPYDMAQAGLAANEARFEAEHSGLPGFSDGPQDAFRHAYWSCLLVLDIGADQAKEVGDIHEDQAKGVSPMITLMDQHNNAMGRLLAQQVKSRSDVAGLVWGELRGGGLLIIENWKARSDARTAGQKPPPAGQPVMSNINPDDLDTSIKPLPEAKFDWVKANTEYRIAREKEMVELLKKPIRAGDVKTNSARNKELLAVTKLAADPYWSGYYRDRFEANRDDDELVTLLRRKLSRRFAGQIKDMLTYADAGKKDKTKK